VQPQGRQHVQELLSYSSLSCMNPPMSSLPFEPSLLFASFAFLPRCPMVVFEHKLLLGVVTKVLVMNFASPTLSNNTLKTKLSRGRHMQLKKVLGSMTVQVVVCPAKKVRIKKRSVP
jgi:hypothetical protein